MFVFQEILVANIIQVKDLRYQTRNRMQKSLVNSPCLDASSLSIYFPIPVSTNVAR
jgi:hypothetical protein